MLYTGFGAHKIINFDPFLALQADIWYSGVSVCKKVSEKNHIGLDTYPARFWKTFNILADFSKNCGVT